MLFQLWRGIIICYNPFTRLLAPFQKQLSMIRYLVLYCAFIFAICLSAAFADEQRVMSDEQVIKLLEEGQYHYGALDQVHNILEGDQLYYRALAADYLGEYGTYTSVPLLISALSDESAHVGANYSDPGMATTRYRAYKALQQLTGEELGYKWDSDLSERRKAIKEWENWLIERDRVILVARDYLARHQMGQYMIYRAHRTDHENDIWGISLTLDPPVIGAPALTVDANSNEITVIPGR